MVRIILVRPNRFFVPMSWIIRLGQMSDISHMAILKDDQVVDATHNGVKFTTVSEYRNKYKIVREYKIKGSNTVEELREWAKKYDDATYSDWQNVGLFFRRIGLLKNNPFGKDHRKIVCCELVILHVRDHGLWKVNDTDEYDLIRVENILKEIKC